MPVAEVGPAFLNTWIDPEGHGRFIAGRVVALKFLRSALSATMSPRRQTLLGYRHKFPVALLQEFIDPRSAVGLALILVFRLRPDVLLRGNTARWFINQIRLRVPVGQLCELPIRVGHFEPLDAFRGVLFVSHDRRQFYGALAVVVR